MRNAYLESCINDSTVSTLHHVGAIQLTFGFTLLAVPAGQADTPRGASWQHRHGRLLPGDGQWSYFSSKSNECPFTWLIDNLKPEMAKLGINEEPV